MENKITSYSNSLVFLTRCSRPQNLEQVCNSVLELRNSLITEGNYCQIVHVIIFDKYKCSQESMTAAKIQIWNLYHSVKDSLFSVMPIFEYRGSQQDNVYGATMLVDAVSNLMSHFESDFDPWLYILDDDNIIHPNFKDVLMQNIATQEPVLIFGQDRDMKRFDGSSIHEDCILSKKNMFVGFDGKLTNNLLELNAISIHTHPDSAQFLIKYKTLMKYGNYSNTYYVDFDTIWNIYSVAPYLIKFIPYVASYYNVIESELLENA